MNPTNANISQYILEKWKRIPPHQIIFEDGEGIKLTRDDCLSLFKNRRTSLKSTIKPNDKVLISSNRGFLFFIDLIVTWSLNAITVPYDGTAELSHIEKLKRLSSANINLHDLFTIDSCNEVITESEYDALPCNNSSGDKLAAILFTSGTTGDPKGVMLTHDSLRKNSFATLNIIKMNGDRLLVNIPFHFTSAICHFLACSFSNSTLVGLETKMMFSQFSEKCFALNPTGIGGAPIQLRWINEHLRQSELNDFNKLQLKFFISSGDYLPEELIQESKKQIPFVKIFTVYGLTELGGRFCILDPDTEPHPFGTVGKPIQGLRLSIYDQDENRELSENQLGEIVASGELLSLGYYNNTKATQASFFEYGFRTGDLGYKDKDQFIFIQGRADDVFKVNGKKVSALVIMEALSKMELFKDVAVIGIDIPVFGVVPFAFYTLKEGYIFKKGATLKELRKTLPNNHMPHVFIPIKEIPRTGSGKIKRKELRLAYLEKR